MIQESQNEFNSNPKSNSYPKKIISPINPSPQYQHFMSQISSILANQKQLFATKIAFNMSQPVLRGIATNSFPAPSLNFIKKADTSSAMSVPTRSSSVSEGHPKVSNTHSKYGCTDNTTTPTTITSTTTTTSIGTVKLKRKRK